MTTAIRPAKLETATEGEEELRPGDHLDQAAFHKLYQSAGPNVHAELIGGVVYMSSPTSPRHARRQGFASAWLGVYAALTPGTVFYDNASIVLSDQDEPQPDAMLTIEQPADEKSEDEHAFHRVPELVCEVAYSSHAYDLFEKKRLFERYGVKEYVVFAMRQSTVSWFVRSDEGVYETHPSDEAGIFKSIVFPGLWLDSQALMRKDMAAVLHVLNQGIASEEHGRFVQALSLGNAPSNE